MMATMTTHIPLSRCLVGLLIVFALVPSSAGAMSLGAVRAALPTSQAVAERHWQTPGRCTGRTTFELLTFARLGFLRTNGVSGDSAIEDADEATCVVRIAWDADAYESRSALCSVVTHAIGHLRGLRFNNPADPYHSLNPRNIMFGTGADERPLVACMRAFIPVDVKQLARTGWSCQPQSWMAAWRCRKPHRSALYVGVV